ncbi:preprotein translocase subunit SecY [Hugenholtzia roseola]|uniref:preprotein translocase subunit SecY n=1 Tax=Hugenholtzia roseola TaxID=1002 RepID=UPI000425D867|nr:preprotein translocase subunit SecY [Hugenholtzia roseola]
MNKFIQTIKNIFSIEELRNRILVTLGFLLVFRLGSYVVLPGVDPDKLEGAQGGLLDFINLFSGGAFSRASVFALGIMPYISASIVIQLLTVAVGYFQKLQKEGESGRKRLNQITRFLTIAITLFQSVAYIKGTIPNEAILINSNFFLFASMVLLTGGTVFCMWLGEKITEKGIGNGVSLLIMIGIVARFPDALWQESTLRGIDGLLIFFLEIFALFFVVVGTVLVIQAVRHVPMEYARQMVGGKGRRAAMGANPRSTLPLKVNAAGVMPIIFAQALMFLPPLIASAFRGEDTPTADYISQRFADFTSWEYNLLFGVLIILFTFFYTAITINPQQIAEDLKRNNAYIPGVQPGEETATHISTIMDRITLPGAIFIAIIAILPALAAAAGVGAQFAQFYGGTSLLIMVGVVLDTLQKIESYLLDKDYEGLMDGSAEGRTQPHLDVI